MNNLQDTTVTYIVLNIRDIINMYHYKVSIQRYILFEYLNNSQHQNCLLWVIRQYSNEGIAPNHCPRLKSVVYILSDGRKLDPYMTYYGRQREGKNLLPKCPFGIWIISILHKINAFNKVKGY